VKSAAELFDLSGKVAVVTGGSRGLGREMVLAYAQAGADVMIVSRKLAACEELARLVESTTSARAFPYGCHVGHWAELDGLVDAAWEHFGKVDVWVNNAGMAPTYEHITDVSEELFDKTVGVNFKGPFRLSALVGARMAQGDGGSVINVSSTGSIRVDPTIIPYAAAKAALNALTYGYAATYGPKVRFNVLMSGPFKTDITQFWTDETYQAIEERHALSRVGDPEEIIGAALYLASDASSYTSCATLRVDGGIP
jgi:NAD(P)-dependent dehydrogenase (short-subunit alcohol dehydrogenase family)